MDQLKLNRVIRGALREDIGKQDITSECLIPKKKRIKAALVVKQDCLLCGINIAAQVFKLENARIKFKPLFQDGQRIKKGTVIAKLNGPAQGILSAERVALNFLSLLCGVSTRTREFVEQVKPYQAKVMDTRKTIPGLRLLEKYAVRIGGGYNHRFSLSQMLLVKDNHLKIIGGYKKLPKIAKRKVEMEVKNLAEFKQALALQPDVIMLDNMSASNIKKAVQIVQIKNCQLPIAHRPLPRLEASGGITLKNVKIIASCGVDMISIGSLTHSINSVDISLEVL